MMPTLQAQLARQNQAVDNQRLGEQVRMAREVDKASNMKLNQLQQQRAYEQQMQQQAQMEQQAMAEQAYATGVDDGARAVQGVGRRDASGQDNNISGISNPEVAQQVVQIASYLDDMVAQGASDEDIHKVIKTIKDPELINGLQEYQMARMQQAEQVQQAQANGQEVAVAPDSTPNLTEYAKSIAIN